jgi:hypothetical protein
MYSLRDALIWLIGVLGLAIAVKACQVQAGTLEAHALRKGFKPSKEVTAAIKHAAKVYSVDERSMLAIAFIESSFNPSAFNVNVNGTVDVGLFQINTVVAKSECVEYNLWNAKGSALCAAKMIAKHKRTGDPLYLGRYHNSRKDLKLKYYNKVKEHK